MSTEKFYKMLDTDHPEYVSKLVGLINWSMNCEYPTPYNLFLDLIGYSEDYYGDKLCPTVPELGYLELDYLSEALREYVHRPTDIKEWIDKLNEAEFNEEDEDE